MISARRLVSLVLVITAPVAGRADDPAGPVYPLSAVVADDGTVYVVDRKLPGVWRSTENGFEVFVRGSKRFREPLNAPRCLALDGKGRLLVGDSATRDVYLVDEKGQPRPWTSEPAGDGKKGRPGAIGIPMDIAVDSKGTVYVSDLESHRIWKLGAMGEEPEAFAVLAAPRGLAVDAEDRLWVVSLGDDQLLRLSKSGEPEVVLAGRPFRFPHEVAITKDGTAYVTDGYGKAVWKVAPGAKKPEALASGKPFEGPVGVTRHGERVLVVDPRVGLLEVDAAGMVSKFVPGKKGSE